MKVSVAHRLQTCEAKDRLEAGLVSMLERFGDSVTNVRRDWDGDTARFSFRAQGFEIKGRLTLSDGMVTVDLGLPLAARLFQGRIRAEVEGGLERILNTG
jgi:hypothetical protein